MKTNVPAVVVTHILFQQLLLEDDTRLGRDEAHINEMAEDFRQRLRTHPNEHPIQNPLRVVCRDDRYPIIAGGYRYLAGLRVPLANAPCIILDHDLSELDLFIEQFRDNKLHRDYDPIEEAQGLVRVMAERGCNQAAAGKVLGIVPSDVTKRLRVFRGYPSDLWPLIGEGDGKVPFTSAYQMARLPDEAQKRELTEKVVKGLLIRDAVEDLVDRLLNGTREKKPKEGKPVIAKEGGATLKLQGAWDWAKVAAFGKRLCEISSKGEKNTLPITSLPQLFRA